MANGAYTFDGANDGISFSHINALDAATKVTAAMYVQTNTTSFGYLLGQIGNTVSGAGNNTGFGVLQNSSDATSIFLATRDNSSSPEKIKSGVLSTSAFVAVWIAYDGTQGTVTNRLRLWIAGTEVTTWDTDSNNFPTALGTTDQAFTIGVGEGSLFNSCTIADVGLLFGRAVTDGTIASHAGGMSIGNYVQSGDLWCSFRTNANDENGGRTATLLDAPTLTTGPSLTFPGGGGKASKNIHRIRLGTSLGIRKGLAA